MIKPSQYFSEQFNKCLDFLAIQARKEHSTITGTHRIDKFIKKLRDESRKYRDAYCVEDET